MFPLLILFVLASQPGVSRFEVVETAPLGSELESASVANAIDRFPELFAEAESSISIAQMYMLYYPPTSRGRLLYRLYDALLAAAARGVEVRILLDSTILEGNPSRTYHRIGRFFSDVPGIEVRSCDLRQFSVYDECMMHAKYFVVDGRTAVLGSHNWSYGAFADNRELSLVVRDSGFARSLARVFDVDWGVAMGDTGRGGFGDIEPGDIRLAVAGPAGLRTGIGLTVVAALADFVGGCRTSLDVEINSLSSRVDFGPGERFGLVDSLLRSAAGRGVRVRLLADRWAWEHDPGLLSSLDSVPGIEVRAIDIRSAGPNPAAGTVHGKLVIGDGCRALVGTATFSQRQLLECRNVAVTVGDRSTVSVLREVFERDWGSRYARAVMVTR